MNNHFTTSKGFELEFYGIATLMDKLNSSRKIPPIPTYEVPTATGIIEKHEHTEKTIETDEEKAAWTEYIKARDAEEQEFNKKSLMMILLKGLRVVNPTAGDDWVAEQRMLGIDVPDDPTERKFHWIYTEVIGNLDDLAAIRRGVEDASGVSEERLSQTADSFRHSLERAEVDGVADSDSGNGALDVHEPIRADESGDGDANAAKPVRRPKHRG